MNAASVDDTLCLLWEACGFSWERLEKRLRVTPFFAGAASALPRPTRDRARALRRRCRDASVAEREASLRWLLALGPRVPAPAADAEMAALSVAALVQRMERAFPVMPRREMQELVRRGAAAVPALVAALRRGRRRPGAPGLVWVVVVAGEIGARESVDALAALLGHSSSEVAGAAAEALGRIGPAAATLMRAASGATETAAAYAYGGLALLRTDETHAFLCATAAASTRHADLAAWALACHGRREAMPVLRALLRRVPSWMRPAVADAITGLRTGHAAAAARRDWRVRYRRVAGLGWAVPPSWIEVAVMVRECRRRGDCGRRSARLAGHRQCEPASRRCGRCGGAIWEPTGLPVCAHTAPFLVELQLAQVRRWCEAGVGDVWTALDACDAADVVRVRPEDGPDPAGDHVAVARATFYWMASLGFEDLLAAARYLRVVARDIRVLYRADHARAGQRRRFAAPRRYSSRPETLPQMFS